MKKNALKGKDGRATNCPPLAYRFKKGIPSSRKGRKFPKAAPTASQLFWKIANEQIRIEIDGNEIKVSRFSAYLRTLQAMKLGGDMAAMRLFNKFSEAFPGKSQSGDPVILVIGAREAKV